MEKEKKVGLTPLNWVLCIAGILFLMTFIVLPPMFRAFIKEENNNNNSVNNTQPTPNNTSSVTSITTICTKSVLEDEEYRIVTENDVNKIIAYTITSDYLETDILNSCEQEELNFINSTGLYNSCQITEGKKVITHRITLPDYQETTSPLPFDYKSTKDEIVNYLTSNGFSCNQETNQ